MLRALTACGYLRWRSGAYRLTSLSRRWLLRSSPRSIRSAILHRNLDLRFMRFEDYVRDGTSADFHNVLEAPDWELYHEGQAGHAALVVHEVVERMPLPRGATDLLDLGGGHGLYSFAFCEKYPDLRAQVLDLDVTFGTAQGSRKRQPSRNRVRFITGDLRTTELAEASYDVVLLANVLHHLDDRTVQRTFAQVARALRSGGVLVALDAVRPASISAAGQVEALLDLYFGSASGAGLWTLDQIRCFQKEAGLALMPPVAMRCAPFMKMQIARRQ